MVLIYTGICIIANNRIIGPFIPTSVIKSVPFLSICKSFVCTCVWVPKTAETLPSKYSAKALFICGFCVQIDNMDIRIIICQNHFQCIEHIVRLLPDKFPANKISNTDLHIVYRKLLCSGAWDISGQICRTNDIWTLYIIFPYIISFKSDYRLLHSLHRPSSFLCNYLQSFHAYH